MGEDKVMSVTSHDELKMGEDKLMSVTSHDDSLAFRDQTHSFFLGESFLAFFFKNCSKNANETSFKKLTVMENVNASMITKKKKYFTHLNLAGEKKKKTEQEL